MRIAILGATSNIAQDLLESFGDKDGHEWVLFARRPETVRKWLDRLGLVQRHSIAEYANFGEDHQFDAIINFVGVGNPAQAIKMGASIMELTLQFDALALNYVGQHPHCRYIFLSSGAAYGSNFEEPVDETSNAVFAINNLAAQDWYGVAKMHAECRHPSLAHLPIVDIRVFNYFSYSADIEARFLITDILRSIREGSILQTSKENIFRDYIGPNEISQLIQRVFQAPIRNAAIDCFTLEPIDKISLLSRMQSEFGLKYELVEQQTGLVATGRKLHYYSNSRKASDLFEYTPQVTSLDVVLQQSRRLLSR
jgi:nucleoside-diphosphate-sugar epimerase